MFAMMFRFVMALLGNPFGRVALIALAAYGAGAWRSARFYEAREAAARAALARAHAQELAREQAAAREIAEAATARADDDAAVARALQKKIDAFPKELRNVPQVNLPPLAAPCAVDGAFLGRLRQLDDAAAGAPAPPRRPFWLRRGD